jgi:hypothetical protein
MTTMKSATIGLAACLAAGVAGVCVAQDLKATPRFSETQIGFDPGASYNNYALNVTGPNGFAASAASKTGTPTIDLRRFGAFDDGNYSYELTATSDEKIPSRTPLDNGRSGGPADSKLRGVALSGQFLVKGSMIAKPSTAPPARLDKDAR